MTCQQTPGDYVADSAQRSLAVATGPSELMLECLKAASAPASLSAGLGVRWAGAWASSLIEIARAACPEDRLKAQEEWLRHAAEIWVDYCCEVDRAALEWARKITLDITRELEVESATSLAFVR